MPYERRELLGVHAQPAGKYRVGIHVPTGRLSVAEARQIADLADKYSGGELRLTVEQNAMLPHVAEAMLTQLLAALWALLVTALHAAFGGGAAHHRVRRRR